MNKVVIDLPWKKGRKAIDPFSSKAINGHIAPERFEIQIPYQNKPPNHKHHISSTLLKSSRYTQISVSIAPKLVAFYTF